MCVSDNMFSMVKIKYFLNFIKERSLPLVHKCVGEKCDSHLKMNFKGFLSLAIFLFAIPVSTK